MLPCVRPRILRYALTRPLVQHDLRATYCQASCQVNREGWCYLDAWRDGTR